MISAAWWGPVGIAHLAPTQVLISPLVRPPTSRARAEKRRGGCSKVLPLPAPPPGLPSIARVAIAFPSAYGLDKPQAVHLIECCFNLSFFKNKKGIGRDRRCFVSPCCGSAWAGGSGSVLLLWMFLLFPIAKLQEIPATLTYCCRASSFHQSTAPGAPGLPEIRMLIFIQLQL